jgi:hypothetical protein
MMNGLRAQAAWLGQFAPCGDLPHCIASLSAKTQSQSTTWFTRINATNVHVSGLLWLIVALGALRVKSIRGSGESFDKHRNSSQTRAFSARAGPVRQT